MKSHTLPTMRRYFLVLTLAVAALFVRDLAAQTSLYLEQLTWEEVAAAQTSGTDTVIINIGATEQHGPQIALSSDSITGDYLVEEIAKRIGRAVIAPSIRVGISAHHLNFPGTISVRDKVIFSLVTEYAHSLVRHGFRHIVIIPTHGGNFGVVAQLGEKLSWMYPAVDFIAFADAKSYIDTMVATSRRLGVPLEVAGSHAGMSETSMALFARPDLVRMNRAQTGFMGDAYAMGDKLTQEGAQSLSPIGALGDPTQATAEAGREYLADLADLLTRYVQERRDRWTPAQVEEMPKGFADPSGPLAEGVLLRRQGKLAEAEAYFAARIEELPDAAQARSQLARTLVLSRAYERARTALEPLLDSGDPAAVALAEDELAMIDVYQGRFMSAIARKRNALRLGSADDDVVVRARKTFDIGFINAEIGRYDEAAQAYGEALAMFDTVTPFWLDIQHLFGLLDLERNYRHRAADRLRTIADVVFEPEFESQIRRVYHLDAELALAEGRPADALINLERIVRIYDHPMYRESQARAHLALQQPRAAEESLRRITNLTDTRLDAPTIFVKAHYQLAELLESQGRREEAAELYRQFLSYWGEADVPLVEVRRAHEALDRQ